MRQTILMLTDEQDKKCADLEQKCVQVVGYYWGAGYLRLFSFPKKQADQFAKLLQRYKDECDKKEGYETHAWKKIHDAKI